MLQRRCAQHPEVTPHEHSVLDAVAAGVYGVDRRGRVVFFNRAAQRLTGWMAEDVLGADAHELLHHTHADGEPYPRSRSLIRATIRDSQPRFVAEGTIWRRDGRCFPASYQIMPWYDERGRSSGAVVTFRDITAERTASEQLRRLEAEQAHAARLSLLGELLASIGHELNQPLTVIATNARACLRLFEQGTPPPDCPAILHIIATQAERGGEVIRQLRRLASKETPALAPVAVATLFETVNMLLREEARLYGVKLDMVSAPGLVVVAQRTQIEQALLNLARNAIEAMADQQRERRLLLVARPADMRVELRVIDTGPGLPRGAAPRLLEPFFTTKPQGLGLGLPIVARILAAHGARLDVETTPGIGTTFSFSLPAASAPTTAPPPRSVTAEATSG